MFRRIVVKKKSLFILGAMLILLLASGCAGASVPEPQAPTESVPEPTRTPAPTPTPTPLPEASPEEATASPPEPTPTPAPPTPTPEPQARYELTFQATWSEETHPTDFPRNPHFSGLIGAVHDASLRLWEVGQLASPGIKSMAETGAKSPLDAEINALIDGGSACTLISGGGINRSPGAVSVTFDVTPDCAWVSVVTMIAPSPDWFVGVSALPLLQEGMWVAELVVPLLPYDAGTDSGASYASSNAPSNPAEMIYAIETEPLRSDGRVPAFGTFTFTRIDN